MAEGTQAGAESNGPEPKLSEDWLAIALGAVILATSLAGAWVRVPGNWGEQVAAARETGVKLVLANPLAPFVVGPAPWSSSPKAAYWPANGPNRLVAAGTVFGVIGGLFAVAHALLGRSVSRFLLGFIGLFGLANLGFLLAGQEVVRHYNLEYVLWALVVGLTISNTIGTPKWLRGALATEFYIKTGLVLLGAEVLLGDLSALGLPGILVSWVVTPITLVATYLFGQLVLRMPSRSLNLVISADMSVCGVSAAIATAAACKATKEELSLAIGLSLVFTAGMMVVQPAVIARAGIDPIVGAAWIGGTIDSTGAVAAAGVLLDHPGALTVATTIKMIQNILIGVIGLAVAIYWVTWVEPAASGVRPSVWEIWRRFPRFIVGFVLASVVFSVIGVQATGGPQIVRSSIEATKELRGWLFCLAFTSIGLETDFRALAGYLKGGKALTLYVVGQSLNLLLSFAMAWLVFTKLFPEIAVRLGAP